MDDILSAYLSYCCRTKTTYAHYKFAYYTNTEITDY